MLTQNTAKANGGSSITVRYSELINPAPKDNRSAEEIVNSIVNGMGLIKEE